MMHHSTHDKKNTNTSSIMLMENNDNNISDEIKTLKINRNKRCNTVLILCSIILFIAYIHHVTFIFHPIKNSDAMMIKSEATSVTDDDDNNSMFQEKNDNNGVIYYGINNNKIIDAVKGKGNPRYNTNSKIKKSNQRELRESRQNAFWTNRKDKEQTPMEMQMTNAQSDFDIRKRLRNILRGYRDEDDQKDVKVIKEAQLKLNSDMEIEIDEILKKKSKSKGVPTLLDSMKDDTTTKDYKRAGVIVLGMHRSGTSMFTGVMKKGLGYYTGGPFLSTNKKDNAKGYFERLDTVNQNNEFLSKQNMSWDKDIMLYDHKKALQQIRDKKVMFLHGRFGLKFMNSVYTSPWIQKDPRMCITLRSWLALLESEPAIIFTYRHPLEVAKSLARRGQIIKAAQDTSLARGLWLWIIYNQKAIQNSNALCRVITSQEAILSDPLTEINRVANEITTKCGVIEPKKKLTSKTINEFIDDKLHHNKALNETVLTTYYADSINNCTVYNFKSHLKSGTQQAWREKELYLIAMKIYCDLKSGHAFRDYYVWPNLHSMKRWTS